MPPQPSRNAVILSLGAVAMAGGVNLAFWQQVAWQNHRLNDLFKA